MGIKMEGGDLDAYITKFEQLVHHMGLNIMEETVLDKFTDGLPNTMYKAIFTQQNAPKAYDWWHEAAIVHQKKWVHLKGRLNQFKNMHTL